MSSPRVAIQGNIGAVLQKEEPYFDPRDGWLTLKTWVGVKAAILAQANLMAASGWRVRVSHRGPNYMVQAMVPTVEGEEPTYIWELATEWRQEEIWMNPKIAGLFATLEDLADERAEIEDAIKQKVTIAEVQAAGWGATQIELFKLIRRGAAACELRTPVLRRRRTIPPGWTSPIIVKAIEMVYTWGRLVADFNVPAIVADRIPGGGLSPLPAAPLGLQWAYKERTAESSIMLRSNKTEEVNEWIFGAVSSMMYDVLDV